MQSPEAGKKRDAAQTPPEHGGLLRVEGLRKRYGGREVVRGVSLELRPGEVLGLLGSNGAGKSTLIKMLAGLVRPDGGQATLGGQSLLGRAGRAARGQIGAVIEGPAFYPQMSGARNLGMLARLRGHPGQRTTEMLAMVGLTAAAQVPFRAYSMGMRQRLALAAAFMHGPAMVILDEPTNGLDPAGQGEIQRLIAELAAGGECGVLLCTHQLHEAAALCHRALVMADGAIVLEQKLAGAPGEEGIARLRAALEGQSMPQPMNGGRGV